MVVDARRQELTTAKPSTRVTNESKAPFDAKRTQFSEANVTTQRSDRDRAHDADHSEYVNALLANRTLIVASNRGPVSFSAAADGTFTSRKGSGGVVTAVSAIAKDRQPVWVAAAMT